MASLRDRPIRHGVVFALVHPEGSPAEEEFLQATRRLATIQGVRAFELRREVSPKNEYRFALTMEFADRAAYQAYNEDPVHVRFVSTRWNSEVADFLEIDTVAL